MPTLKPAPAGDTIDGACIDRGVRSPVHTCRLPESGVCFSARPEKEPPRSRTAARPRARQRMHCADEATQRVQHMLRDVVSIDDLSDDEIEKMVKDAESHAEEDKKFHDLVAARNQADNLIHATNKSMEDLGDKVSADEKEKVQAAIKDLEEVMKSDDKDAIEEKTKVLVEASGKIAEKAYAQAQSQGGADKGAAGGAGGGAGEAHGASSGGGEEVVDAEFEEVKDDK